MFVLRSQEGTVPASDWKCIICQAFVLGRQYKRSLGVTMGGSQGKWFLGVLSVPGSSPFVCPKLAMVLSKLR